MLRTACRFVSKLTTPTITHESTVKTAVSSIPQATNHPETWSTNQQPKSLAMQSPRCVTASNLSYTKPSPLSAMELIAQHPIQKVTSRIVACDGGGGALGHPRVYINLDRGVDIACGYCGTRFEMESHHH